MIMGDRKQAKSRVRIIYRHISEERKTYAHNCRPEEASVPYYSDDFFKMSMDIEEWFYQENLEIGCLGRKI